MKSVGQADVLIFLEDLKGLVKGGTVIHGSIT